MASNPSFVTIAGLKKSGKTTVAEALIGELVRRGLRVASIKSMMHGAFHLEPEGTDTRRHLAAGAEVVLTFSAEEDAVFARRSSSGPRDRLESWLPPGVDWVVCEGQLAGVPADRVILCLEQPRDFAEALAVRGLEASAVIAASGVAAGGAGRMPSEPDGEPLRPQQLPVPLLDARDPRDLARLADLVLSGSPRASRR
ncbi:MAG: molybdopterin-guanine dinucleotide biosynthesis protein MobB, partial [Spirochaetes bacterium]|nr:molybdopterin-guanine dinucleotide biosynthesis protein MobB [Spirochaetota bacterium]